MNAGNSVVGHTDEAASTELCPFHAVTAKTSRTMRRAPARSGSVAPGPRDHFLLGSLPDMRRDPLQMLEGFRQRYGDVVHFRLGRNHCYQLSHPDHVRHVLRDNSSNYRKALFFDKIKVLLGNGLLSWPFQDDFWRSRRRLCQPPFQRQSLEGFVGQWALATEERLDDWEDYADSGREFDAAEESMDHTLDLAARTLFSINTKSADGETVARSFTICLEYLMHKVQTLIDLPEYIPTPRNIKFLRARGALDELIYRLIAERQTGEKAPDDFLAAFLRANDRDPSPVSVKQLRDDLITLFIAGFETNASALTWSLWLLTQHPEYEEPLRQEVTEAIGERRPTYEDLADLPLNRMFVDEALRLYPPSWWLTRAALSDDEVGGYKIPAGATIVLSQWVTHRHPDFWDNPDSFDPYRFTPERSAERPALAYFPFGDGPRTCIAKHFALIQMQLVLAMVVQRYQLATAPGQELKPRPLITMRPDRPLLLRLKRVAKSLALARPA